MITIDLNADAGEVRALIEDGSQRELIGWLTSVNVACGGHAGDQWMMQTTVDQARSLGVAVGAHPGYPDPHNFGRVPLDMPAREIARSVEEQVAALGRLAADLRHVKPHGALYNVAVRDERVAEAIAAGVAAVTRDVVLVGLAGSIMLDVFEAAGFRVAPEGFADRLYEPDGTLRARKHPDAVIADPDAAAAQALRIALSGEAVAAGETRVHISAQTLCVHGDTPGAASIAAAVRARLEAAGIRVASLGGPQARCKNNRSL